MAKKIIFEGAAVSDDTRDFFLKMAKIAYDDNLNVTLTERPEEHKHTDHFTEPAIYSPGCLIICIWKEEDIIASLDKTPST